MERDTSENLCDCGPEVLENKLRVTATGMRSGLISYCLLDYERGHLLGHADPETLDDLER